MLTEPRHLILKVTGAAILFWPAAPAFLLMKGKDVNLNKGMIFDTFTDQDHALASLTPSGSNNPARPAPAPPAPVQASASVTITSDAAGADIEVDGAFVGNTPTTIPVMVGAHQVLVRNGSAVWQRNLQVSAGSTITLNAQVRQVQQVSRSLR